MGLSELRVQTWMMVLVWWKQVPCHAQGWERRVRWSHFEMNCTVFCSMIVQSAHLAPANVAQRGRVGDLHAQTTRRTLLRLPVVDITWPLQWLWVLWHPVTASLLIKSQKGVSNHRQTCIRQPVKNYHGITERPHLIDPRPTELPKAVRRVREATSFCIATVRIVWKMAGWFHGMLCLSAKRPTWWKCSRITRSWSHAWSIAATDSTIWHNFPASLDWFVRLSSDGRSPVIQSAVLAKLWRRFCSIVVPIPFVAQPVWPTRSGSELPLLVQQKTG